MLLIKGCLTGKGSIGQNQESNIDSRPKNSTILQFLSKRLRLILSVMKIGPVLLGEPGETEGDPDRACLELTTSALLSNSKVPFIHSATDQVRNGLAWRFNHPAKNY